MVGQTTRTANLGKPRVTDCLLQTQASVGELAFLAGVVSFWQLDCKVIEPDFWFYVVKRDCWNCGTDFWNFGRVHCGRMFQKIGWVLAQLQPQQKGGGSEMDWVPYCVIGTTGKVCCCNSQWWLTENVGATGVNKNLTKSRAVKNCWGG